LEAFEICLREFKRPGVVTRVTAINSEEMDDMGLQRMKSLPPNGVVVETEHRREVTDLAYIRIEEESCISLAEIEAWKEEEMEREENGDPL
jgi:hypothetical protein